MQTPLTDARFSFRSAYHRLGEPATGRHREEKAVRHRSRTAFSFQFPLYLGSLTPIVPNSSMVWAIVSRPRNTSALGQSRRLGDVTFMSAYPPITEVKVRIANCSDRPNSDVGRSVKNNRWRSNVPSAMHRVKARYTACLPAASEIYRPLLEGAFRQTAAIDEAARQDYA